MGITQAMATAQDPNPPSVSSLNDAERQLLETMNSKLIDLRVGDTDVDNPANADKWGNGRSVRAELLAYLLTREPGPAGGRLQPVKLSGARITGTLDLEACKLLRPLLLLDCHFDDPVNLKETEAISIRIPGCHIPSISARQIRTTGSLELNDSSLHGGLHLVGAHIGGNLELRGTTLSDRETPALDAEGIIVDQNMICDEIEINGEAYLRNARIEGALNLAGATIHGRNGNAINADSITIGRHMSCAELTAHGEVNLNGAHIDGHLNLEGASLSNPNGFALNADALTASLGMFCRRRFTAHGQIRLMRAHIERDIAFDGAIITNNDGPVLIAEGLTTDGGVKCRNGFTAHGQIQLTGAQIGGNLDFSKSNLVSDNAAALIADGLVVGGAMICSEFTAQGGIRLLGAQISTQVIFERATLINEIDNDPVVNAVGLTAKMGLIFENSSVHGEVDLTNATVGVFDDDQKSWPDALKIGGFVYDSLGNQEVSPHARLQWLQRHPGRFAPGIYDQLADVYRRTGDEGAARKVAVAKQWRRRKPYNPLSWLWWVTVGYGYRTWQAFVWAAVLAVTGSLIFRSAYPAHMIAASQHGTPPRFQPVIYTLDVLLPIGGLGQKSAWQPTGGYLDWYWAFAIAGWVLSAAVVAGLTGILKRD